MAINLTTLFTRIGKMGGILNTINTSIGTTIPAKTDSLADQYNSSDRDIREGLYNAQSRWWAANLSFPNHMKQLARETLIEMVRDDNPQPDLSLRTALVELIRQMEVTSDDVLRSVVAATVAATAGNVGDASIVVSVKLPSGRSCENLFAEDVVLKVTADSETGGEDEGEEPWRAQGEYPESNPLRFDWPRGSGSSMSGSLVDADQDAIGANMNYLTNGHFEDFTVANTPDNWTIDVGSAGTTILKQTGAPFAGLAALQFVGNGAELTSVYQTFDSAAGTITELVGDEQYAVNGWLRISPSAPSTGVLQIALTDGSGTIVNDEEGVANSFTVALTSATTSYVAFNGSFRTPHIMPAAIRLRLKLTTALESGKSVFIDHVALTRHNPLYTQGPSIVAFSGSTRVITGDSWTITLTNTEGEFQELFDKFFGMKALQLLLPSDPAPTISDALIA